MREPASLGKENPDLGEGKRKCPRADPREVSKGQGEAGQRDGEGKCRREGEADSR